MYFIYWIISESKSKTYIGFTDNIERRVLEHREKKVKTTRDFGNFKAYILEKVATLEDARRRERYWKSCAGRKRLKKLFDKISNKPLSSSG